MTLTPTMLKAVLLDMGNTVVYDKGFSDILQAKVSWAIRALTGLEVRPRTVAEVWEQNEWGREDVELWDLAKVMLLLRRLGLLPGVRLVERVYAAVLEAYLEGFGVEPSAHAAIQELKEMGLKVGVLTNVGSYDVVKLRLQSAGLIDLVDVVVASQAFPWRKPSRRIFEAACFLLDAPPPQTVYVGDDAEVDIAGAKAAGLKAIQVLKYAKEKSSLADAWIQDLGELPKVIERLLDREARVEGLGESSKG